MSEPEGTQPAKRRRILLRLDDGSLIGPANCFFGGNNTAPTLVDCEQACSLGKASQKDVDRLQALINEYQRRNEFDATHKPHMLKPFNPYTPEGQRALKKKPSLNGDVHAQQGGAGAAAAADGYGGTPGDFSSRCMAVLKKMYAMGPSTLVLYGMSVKDIFYKPVSTTFPGIAQSYYSVIKQPMTLGQIEDKLNKGRYSSPAQFAQEVRLVWNNCRTFNTNPQDEIRRAGDKMSDAFEQAWAASGLCNEARAKRATAGVAAAKFEPDEELPAGSHQQQQQQAPKSQQGAPRNGQQHADPGVSGAAPTVSHEVNQGGDDDDVDLLGGEYTREKLWLELIDVIQEMDDPMEALGMLDDGVVTQGEDGDVELDPDLVTIPSLIKVDTFIRSLKGEGPRFPVTTAAPKQQQPAAPGAAAAKPAAAAPAGAKPATSNRSRGVRVVDESDDDYAEEESDSDDD